MFTIFEIPQPGLQCRRVVFADHLAICDDVCLTTDACPFARRVEEGDVDFGIRFQIISLARFGIRVEQEINTTALLHRRQEYQYLYGSFKAEPNMTSKTNLCGQGHAPGCQQSAALDSGGHHAELAC